VASRVERETWREALVRSAPDGSLARSVLTALGDFLRTDGDLLISDVNERTITGRLADHLRGQLPGWNADCEYNRDDHNVKRANGRIVMPDIIVHRRGTPDDLLVIEVKKSNTAESDDEDLGKLEEFKTCHLGYRNALFLKLSIGPQAPGVQRVRWV
jgi:hypothetical protein